MTRPRILIVGRGAVGLRVAGLLAHRFCVFTLARGAPDTAQQRNSAEIALCGDLDEPLSLSRLNGIAPYIIHLVPPPGYGRSDSRTRHLIACLGPVKRMVYISTSGVYGNCDGARFDETRPVRPESDRAWRRLDAEHSLRQWARRAHVRLSILRTPGIYAPERLPIARLQSAMPTLAVSDDVYTNHIHADDLARLIVACLWRAAPSRVYHANDDSELLAADYFDLVADTLALARPQRVTRPDFVRQVPAGVYSFMRESRRLQNVRIKHELGFRLRYPTVRDGLLAIRSRDGRTAHPSE